MIKFKSKKKFGQHFLKNEKIIDDIVNLIELENKNIIEIGPGLGALTKAILKKKPRFLVSIEKDYKLEPYLSPLVKKYDSNFILKFNDALKINIEEIYKKDSLILIANLPYNIATTLLINCLQYIEIFDSLIVMVQKEVADRLTAQISSKSYGRVSVLMQLYCEIEKKFDVYPKNFTPPPGVVSSVIHIMPKKKINEFNYNSMDLLLKNSFRFRRKKLKNNLLKYYNNVNEMFSEKNYDSNLRAQDVNPKNFVEILNFLN